MQRQNSILVSCIQVDCYVDRTTISELVAKAETTVSECASGQNATCATALQTARDALLLAVGCTNGALEALGVTAIQLTGQDPLCGALVQAALVVLGNVQQLVTDCVAGSVDVCQKGMAAAASLLEDVDGCMSAVATEFGFPQIFSPGTDPGCGGFARTASYTAGQVLSITGACAYGAAQAIDPSQPFLGSSGYDALGCQTYATTAVSLANAGADAIRGCARETAIAAGTTPTTPLVGADPGCGPLATQVVAAVKQGVGLAGGCLAGAASAAGHPELLQSGPDLGCGPAVTSGLQTLNNLLTLTNGCLNGGATVLGHPELFNPGADPGCAALVDTVRAILEVVKNTNSCPPGLEEKCAAISDLVSNSITTVAGCAGLLPAGPGGNSSTACEDLGASAVGTVVGAPFLVVGLALFAAGTGLTTAEKLAQCAQSDEACTLALPPGTFGSSEGQLTIDDEGYIDLQLEQAVPTGSMTATVASGNLRPAQDVTSKTDPALAQIGGVSLPGGGDPGGSCDPSSVSEQTAYQYAPQVLKGKNDKNNKQSYGLVVYQREHAHFRPSSLEQTWQLAPCVFGGAHSYNGWRVLSAGLGITVRGYDNPKGFYRVDQAWDTSVDDGLSSGSISFTGGVPGASVGVGIGTTANGRNSGEAGTPPTSKDPLYKINGDNAIYAYWQNVSRLFVPPPSRGSQDFQGTVLEGLYEMGESTEPSVDIYWEPLWSGHCGGKYKGFGGCG